MVNGPALVRVSLPSPSANGSKHGLLEFVFVEGQHKLEAPFAPSYPNAVCRHATMSCLRSGIGDLYSD